MPYKQPARRPHHAHSENSDMKKPVLKPILIIGAQAALLLVLSACSALPFVSRPAQVPSEPTNIPVVQPVDTPQTPEPIRLAEITFRVTIPTGTPSDGPIRLSILDEVTGLALNPLHYVMQAETDNIYTVTIQLPADAVIQYRYTRGSEIPAAEHTIDGRPVRYRLLFTRVSGSVHDIITRWNDTVYDGPTGRVFGTITDSQTGSPIPDVLVTAGGHQTVTRWDGTFLITGLPPGTHNLVAYAKNAAYTLFQQGAVIAADAGTPAVFSLDPRPDTKVTFLLKVPEGTIPGVPVRIAGNVYQLGNTFADLNGGISTPASRLPLMAFDPDNASYTLTLDLPSGAYIRYKYTVGDGFWNAETNADGGVVLHEFIVPASDTVLDDAVINWATAGDFGSIWFAAKTPPGTPQTDTLWLQLNPWGWTEPLPMWRVSADEWVYLLSSPLNIIGDVEFRYCRNAQCDTARDVEATGPRTFHPHETFQPFEEDLVKWISFNPYAGSIQPSPTVDVLSREPGFITGIALSDNFHPSWMAFASSVFRNARSNGANTIVLKPTWTYTRDNPPVFEPVNGIDMSWLDAIAFVRAGRGSDLDLALFPDARFNGDAGTWWDEAPRDYSWWVNWFEQYGYFLEHHAALAKQIEAGRLVIGGSWVYPALPNGFLIDDFTSGVPGDAEARWRDMISSARQRYQGRIAWALTFPKGVQNAPPFLDLVDEFYILWDYPLTNQTSASLEEMTAAAEKGLDHFLLPFYLQHNKPLVIEISIPAYDGGAMLCPQGGCDVSGNRDLEEQLLAYEAILRAVNARDWIQGVVSAEYYPPVEIRDKSASIHGKPAEILLREWFTRWLQIP